MFDNRKVVCFGMGAFFKSYFSRLKRCINIEYVCDNDKNCWDKIIEGESIRCSSPQILLQFNNPVVIITLENRRLIGEIEDQLDEMRIEHYTARDILQLIDYYPDNSWIEDPTKIKIQKFIDLNLTGTTICNFHCDYCTVWRKKEFNGDRLISMHSVEEIRKGLSQEKLGGICFINLCALGETFLADGIIELVYELLAEGHYVSVVTNGTVTKKIEEVLRFPEEFQSRFFFKISFHFIELQKKKMFNIFWNNIEVIKKSRCSYTIEIVPFDGIIDNIPDIKNMFEEKANGAMPHVSFARDSTKVDLDVLTELELSEYKEIWGQFDSKMFELKSRNYGKKITNYCYAGCWSYLVNCMTGDIRPCYRQDVIGNIFEFDKKKFPETPIGHQCNVSYCFNNHAFLSWGVVPDIKEYTYLEMRDRIDCNNNHWVREPMYSFMNQKLYDNNYSFGDYWGDYEKLYNQDRKSSFLIFNSPDYPNIGDIAIGLSERVFLNTYFSEYDVIEISCKQYEKEKKKIQNAVKKEDIIFITGGGNIGSLWLNIEDYVTSIINTFTDNTIIVFPQTIYFEEDNVGNKEKEEFVNAVKKHSNIILAVREEHSYNCAIKMLGCADQVMQVPDMALNLRPDCKKENSKGALLCIREDKESKKIDISAIERALRKKIECVEKISSLPVDSTSLEDRAHEVEKVCNMLASKEIVVTDRLHCMILCALVGTPCVAFDNVSGKLSGVYNWIKKLSYIKLIKDEDDIEQQILSLVGTQKTENDKKVFVLLKTIFEKYAMQIRGKIK